MVPTETKTVIVDGRELVAEASLNNCSNAWTATVVSGGRLVATGAGTSAAEAIEVALGRVRAAAAS
jgi:hypothetical protein